MQAQIPQAHSGSVTEIVLLRVFMEIQPRDLSDRLGVKNSNKDTSEFLTLYPSLNLGGFLAFVAVLGRFQRV